jgi:hypothetical protein
MTLRTKRLLALSVIWIAVAIMFLYLWIRRETVNWLVVGGLFALAMARIAWFYRKQNVAAKTDPSTNPN